MRGTLLMLQNARWCVRCELVIHPRKGMGEPSQPGGRFGTSWPPCTFNKSLFNAATPLEKEE